MKRFRSLIVLLVLLLVVGGTAAAQDDGPGVQSTDAFWEAAYWNNQSLSGEPAVRRTESQLDHDWGAGSPASGIGNDNFSARWTRYIEVPPPSGGTYRFVATSDDGIRVWVNEALIIDQWNDHSVSTFSRELNLSPGHHKIQVEYYENAGDAVAKVAYYNVEGNYANWRGAYYDTRWLTGEPRLVRDDPAIDFNWGQNAPFHGMPADHFSVRWTRQFSVDNANAGSWRLTATADDGIRVWVNGQLLISEWSEHPAQTFTAETQLSAGVHELKVEYFEATGFAVARVHMEPAGGPTFGDWKGSYFNNRTLSGSPVLVRDDAAIDFNWAAASPAGLPNDNFSARWTRTVNFNPGTYRFSAWSDDGIRVWVDGQLLIDRWMDQAYYLVTADKYVSGPTDIRVEYYEHGGEAVVRVFWEHIGAVPPPPPGPGSQLVDAPDVGFVRGGSESDWHVEAEGHNGSLYWTRNSDAATSGYNWARWYPYLTAGRYEVFVYIPDRFTTTSMARYWISHRDGFTQRIVNQSAYSDEWVSLGTYWFSGTDQEYVSLADVTYEPARSTLIAYDAMKWERR